MSLIILWILLNLAHLLERVIKMNVTILKLKEAASLEREKIEAMVEDIVGEEEKDIYVEGATNHEKLKYYNKCLNIFYNNLNSIEAVIQVIKDGEQLLLDDRE